MQLASLHCSRFALRNVQLRTSSTAAHRCSIPPTFAPPKSAARCCPLLCILLFTPPLMHALVLSLQYTAAVTTAPHCSGVISTIIPLYDAMQRLPLLLLGTQQHESCTCIHHYCLHAIAPSAATTTATHTAYGYSSSLQLLFPLPHVLLFAVALVLHLCFSSTPLPVPFCFFPSIACRVPMLHTQHIVNHTAAAFPELLTALVCPAAHFM